MGDHWVLLMLWMLKYSLSDMLRFSGTPGIFSKESDDSLKSSQSIRVYEMLIHIHSFCDAQVGSNVPLIVFSFCAK